jgi:D-glycero-alpha-D-manno-heptose-7-phosphate kinase
MIISRTPFRISFFGGGTDYPAWFSRHGGAVIGTTIDKYCYLSVRRLPPFFAHKHRIVWSEIELVNDIGEIRHPAVNAILREMDIEDGMEIAYNADLPARSGLGSSSAFIVGLLNALYALNGRRIAKHELGAEAVRIEQEVMKEAVGNQDQIWAAHGGLNRIDFHPDGSYDVAPLIVDNAARGRLQDSLMLFFTGFSRDAFALAQRQIDNMEAKHDELGRMAALVDDAADLMCRGENGIADFGGLMHESWMMKRSLADGVTTPDIDAIYDKGRAAGAYGGKLLGAGGGGFMLFVVPSDARARLSAALSDLIQVSFAFETGGSRIVVFEPEDGAAGK